MHEVYGDARFERLAHISNGASPGWEKTRGGSGRCWTRTSDPYDVSVVLCQLS